MPGPTRSLRALALAALLAAGPAAASDAPNEDAFGALAGAECAQCYALILSDGRRRGAEMDALEAALARNGFAVTRHRGGKLIALDSRVIRFFRQTAGKPGARLLIYSDLDLEERDYGQALAADDTERAAPRDGRLDALPLDGLLDMMREAAPTSAILALDGPDLVEVKPRITAALDGAAPAVIHRSRGGEQVLEAVMSLLETGAKGVSFQAGGVYDVAGLRRAIEEGPQDDGGVTAPDEEELRRAAWEGLRGSDDLAAVQSFKQSYCSGVGWPAECDQAQALERHLLAVMSEEVSRCHKLAAHPDDPRAKAEGVTHDRMDARAAQAACFAAVGQNPDDPLLNYQLGRALDKLGNVREALRRYTIAADAGHAHAAYNLSLLLADGGRKKQAVEVMRRAAAAGLTDAWLQIAVWLYDGTATGRSDPKGAIEILERFSELPDAAYMMAQILDRKDASMLDLSAAENALRRSAERARPEIARQLVAYADDLSERMKTRIETEVRERQAKAMAQCRRLLNYRPLDVLGLEQLRSNRQMKDFPKDQARRLLLRIDVEKAIETCDVALNAPDAPPQLVGRYGYLLSRAAYVGRRVQGARSGWLPLLSRAAEAKDPDSMVVLGNHFLINASDANPQDFLTGMQALRDAQRAGRKEATLLLALAHLDMIRGGTLLRFKSPDMGLRLLQSPEIARIPLTHVALSITYSAPQKRRLTRIRPDRQRAAWHLQRAKELGWQM